VYFDYVCTYVILKILFLRLCDKPELALVGILLYVRNIRMSYKFAT